MLPICDVRSNPVDLGPKLGSAERALAAIRAGSRIYIGTGCAAPRALLAAQTGRGQRPKSRR
jgi:hypothetical protein